MGVGRRAVIRTFNVIYLAATGLAIGALCTKPLFSLSASVTVPSTTLSSVLTTVAGNEETGGGEEQIIVRNYDINLPHIEREGGGSSLSDYITPELIKENVGDITIEISGIELPAKACFQLDNPSYLQDLLLNKNSGVLHNAIYSAAASVTPDFKRLIKTVALQVANTEIKNQVTSQIEQFKGEGAVTSEIYETIGGDETVSQITENIYNLLDGDEGVPVEDLVNTIMNGTEENPVGVMTILQDLQDQGVEGFVDIELDKDVNEDQIKDAMLQALESIPGLVDTNEEGETVINNLDNALAALLSMLGGNNDSNQDEKPADEKEEEHKEDKEEEVPTKVFITRADTNESEKASLEDEITKLIENMIPESVWNVDLTLGGYAQYVLFGLIALSIAPWALFALVTLIRTLRPKKCWTKPWIIFVLAIIQMILTVGTIVGLKYLLPMAKEFIAPNLGEFSEVASTLTINIGSSIAVPGIIYLIMIPFSIIYVIVCGREKKDFKAAKKAKKAAK